MNSFERSECHLCAHFIAFNDQNNIQTLIFLRKKMYERDITSLIPTSLFISRFFVCAHSKMKITYQPCLTFDLLFLSLPILSNAVIKSATKR